MLRSSCARRPHERSRSPMRVASSSSPLLSLSFPSLAVATVLALALITASHTGCSADEETSSAPPTTAEADSGGPASSVPPPSKGADYLIVTADGLSASADHFREYRESDL